VSETVPDVLVPKRERDDQWQNALREAVNENCSCGGNGPGEGCAACEVWHATLGMMGQQWNGRVR
jgi:hypothetical protein